MTVYEMQQLFETLLQTTDPNFNITDKPDTDTILRFLNLAQTGYIKEKYLSYPTFIERTLALGSSLLDLGGLIKSSTVTVSSTSPYDNSILINNTSDDYWHVLKIVSKISRTKPYALSLAIVTLRPINIESIDRYLTTINNKPLVLTPVFTELTITGGTKQVLAVIYDSYTTFNTSSSNNVMVYLRKPKTLNLTTNNTTLTTTCELAVYLHNDIVKYAQALYEDEKYKLSTLKNKLEDTRAKRIIGSLGEQSTKQKSA